MNCGNQSARVFKRWQWFTFCFVPIIPFSLKPWHEGESRRLPSTLRQYADQSAKVGCHICNFFQDIKYRPDIQQQVEGGGGAGGQIPMNNYGPGPGGPPPGQGGYQYPQQGYQPPPNQGKPQYS